MSAPKRATWIFFAILTSTTALVAGDMHHVGGMIAGGCALRLLERDIHN
jgi:hypothetical protein